MSAADDSEVLEAPDVEPAWGRVPLASLLKGLSFAVVAVGVVVGLHVYLAVRLASGLHLSGGAAEAVWAGAVALFCSLFAGLFARRLPRALALPIRLLAYGWMGLFALLASATAAVDLLSALAAWVRGQPLAARWGEPELAAVAAIAGPAFVWGTLRALAPARIERVSVPIASLPADLEGYRLVQLSDLHLGETLGRGFARRVVAQVEALAPDAVVVTGDLADGSAERTRSEVEPLGALRAPDGVYFVTGNHEYYNGVTGWLSEVRRLGMQVLLNEHRVIVRGSARLVLGGVTDYNAGEMLASHVSSPESAFAGAPEGTPRILLAHQPRSAFEAQGLRIDLQLSGHTHGGQFFPWKYLVRLQQPVLAGLAMIGTVRVYTHRGTGFWGPPLRLFAPPEIAELTLVRG